MKNEIIKEIEEQLNTNRCDHEVTTQQVIAFAELMEEYRQIKNRYSISDSYCVKHQVERFYQKALNDPNAYCSNNRVKFALYLMGYRLRTYEGIKVDSKDDEDIKFLILDNGTNFEFAKPIQPNGFKYRDAIRQLNYATL